MVRTALYAECSALLESAGIPDAGFDSMCIMQDVLGDRNPLLFKPDEEVAPELEERMRSLVGRRCEGEPLQYILGQWDFWSYTFKVGEGVLIPRPDTETLIEEVLGTVDAENITAPRIIDLCSGSGCIAITLKKELPQAEVTAVELSEKALFYLRQNAQLNGADINIIAADVLDPKTAELPGEFDAIVSNPPYLTADEMNDLQTEVAREPSMALFGGADGLDFYRALTPLWKNKLRVGGRLFYEFGMGQHDAVAEIMRQNGFSDIRFAKDAGGIIRTVSAMKHKI